MLFVNHFTLKPRVIWFSLWPAYLCPWWNRTVSSVLVVTIQYSVIACGLYYESEVKPTLKFGHIRLHRRKCNQIVDVTSFDAHSNFPRDMHVPATLLQLLNLFTLIKFSTFFRTWKTPLIFTHRKLVTRIGFH
jgi:hypothetical protein